MLLNLSRSCLALIFVFSGCASTPSNAPLDTASAKADPVAEQGPCLTATVPASPRAFTIDGKRQMAWELLLENCASESLVVDEVTLSSGPLKKTLSASQIAGTAMHLKRDAKRASGIARVSLKTDRLQIPAGETAAIYLWHEALTMTLVHGVRFSGAHATDEIKVSVEPAAIASSVAPPLLGPGWFSSSAPSNQTSHRRAFYQIDTGMKIAQRFAIDFVRTDQEGIRIHGDPTLTES